MPLASELYRVTAQDFTSEMETLTSGQCTPGPESRVSKCKILRESEQENQTPFTTDGSQIGFHDYQL